MRRVLPVLLAIFVLVGLALPGAAGAAQWTAATEECGGLDPERGSGQMDAAGNLYLACSKAGKGAYNHIGIFDQAGRKTRLVPLTFPVTRAGYLDRAADVAPSPDGSILYVVRYDDRTLYRFFRQPDGSYLAGRDGWALERFPAHGGVAKIHNPRGQFVATDAAGDIYFSSGLWTVGTDGSDDAIVKYAPNGTFITRFGRRTGGSALGETRGSFGGLAVTADGRRVFATDINNSRIQRFDRQDADGSYRAVRAIGPAQSDDAGCFRDGLLAAAYDLSMSPGGELLAISTTCFGRITEDGTTKWADQPFGNVEVQRFGQDGTVRGSITGVSVAGKRVHGIAVDRAGNIHLPQGGIVLPRQGGYSDAGADAGGGGPLGGTAVAAAPAPPAGPLPGAPDTTAPVLTSATTAATTQGRAISLALAATDDAGVTEFRIREDGQQYAWRGWATTAEHTLADRMGAHTLVVQVRDAAGNLSAEQTLVVTRVAPPAAQPATPAPKPAPKPAPRNPVPPTVVGGGGGDTVRPKVRSVAMPVQIVRGRSMRVTVKASDNRGATQVRYSTNGGRWGAWRTVRRASTVMLPTGSGWKGVFVQVRDAAGNRSTPWYQPVFVAKRGATWWKGTSGADTKRFGAGTQHIDLSSFDGKVDRVNCGAGVDSVLAQPSDIVGRDCEHVVRVQMPTW